MPISLDKIGFWKCFIVALCFKVAHFALSYRYPLLAQHYQDSLDPLVRILFVSEFFLLMLTFLVAFSTIRRSVSAMTWTWVQVLSISICYGALFLLYGFLSRWGFAAVFQRR
jgi:hypothetical protein